MSFADAARTCLTTKYATFSGRARRAEYWWFSVVYVGAAVAFVGLGFAIEVLLLSVLIVPFIALPLTQGRELTRSRVQGQETGDVV
ncbi:DUF805 domain-containing protein [Streptomyces europaeiscabiei]|uniref:DUF805 domain-containing protein n=1 Tax=Streptomyces europaeiscabiei TaxID=146819 RepID=UPI0029A2E21B|nr:DUF805 domain-containing protein [Streptomyces europaeiscabiei]MDX3695819.1 DUF805 domain-containing protein [Streptomyces europaeiscabiei]